ncbi:MAG TPA: LysR family transcriptional regulator [Rhizomicrobium sp.]|nr:LysR family transcriptional regulator [Rhizomicrobium sp.]
MDPKPPTLDQISVFLAVVENGSFTGAARRLGRAPSVISYAIANLETQLGVTLFARAGTARPKLTAAGRAVLSDSRNMAIALDGLLAKARGLISGLEAEVSLVVDVMWPAKKLVKVLDEFRRKFPTVALRLQVETLGAVTHVVLERTAVFGISGPLELASDLLVRGPAGSVRLVPVAAPSHPLALMDGPITAAAARDHLQLVLTDRSALTQGRDFGVLAVRSWRLADLGAKHALLVAGMGWGNMPKPMVNEDLKRGRLVELKIETPGEPVYPFHTVYRSDAPPGPAGSWLMERLAAA